MEVQGLKVMKGAGVHRVERLENMMERRVLRAGKGTGAGARNQPVALGAGLTWREESKEVGRNGTPGSELVFSKLTYTIQRLCVGAEGWGGVGEPKDRELGSW